MLLSCGDKDQGCRGGDAYNAFEWMSKNEITDETCSVYLGRGFDNGKVCSATIKCKECFKDKECEVPSSYNVYGTD